MKSFIINFLLVLYIIHSILFYYVTFQPLKFGSIAGMIYTPIITLVPSPLYLLTLAYSLTVSSLFYQNFIVSSLVYGLFLFIPAFLLFAGFYKRSRISLYILMSACFFQIPVRAFLISSPYSILVTLIAIEFVVSLVYFLIFLFIRDEFS